jgi:hypothetical protein
VICTIYSADIQLCHLSYPKEPPCELYSYLALFHIITCCVTAMKYGVKLTTVDMKL